MASTIVPAAGSGRAARDGGVTPVTVSDSSTKPAGDHHPHADLDHEWEEVVYMSAMAKKIKDMESRMNTRLEDTELETRGFGVLEQPDREVGLHPG